MRKRGAKVYCEKSRAKKHMFPTQEKAEQYMRNMIMNARTLEDGLPQRVYYCESCGGWHMTSKAHILQKHIDDGSAVLNPTPIVVEQIPASIILHEDRLYHLRNFYNSWERKCKDAQTKIEKRQIMAAKVAIEKLIRNRIERELYWVEREYLTDWRKRLVEKTLTLYRRVNNILNGNTRKNRPTKAMPVIKNRYLPEPVPVPNPLEIINELRRESLALLQQLDDPCFYSSIESDEGSYIKARKYARETGRLLGRREEEADIAIACFSLAAEPLKTIVDRYVDIMNRLVVMSETAVKEENEYVQSRLKKLSNAINNRLGILNQGQPTYYLYTIMNS